MMVASSHVVAEHGSFNLIRQVVRVCTPYYIVSWSHASLLPKQDLDRCSHFCRANQCADSTYKHSDKHILARSCRTQE